MSIGYEEALETLQAMFGEKWTRDDLDTVLRHHQGHMENTVDMILRHGDGEPAVLLQQIEQGIDPRAQTAEMDAALARQLSQSGRPPTSPSKPTTGRGTPTILPDDFLRLPNGMQNSSSQLVDDEALARMLQDQMFSEEVRRNPELAHLARGRPRTAGGVPVGAGASQRGRVPAGGQPPDMENVVKALGNLGNNAKRQFQTLAAQFQAKMKQAQHHAQNLASGGNSGPMPTTTSPTAAHERRGLLDEDDDGEEVALEFASRKDM